VSVTTRVDAVAAAPAHPPREATLLEVQALRALAVLLVVAYHVWPGRVPGGFIGVDVFFVISGFLITDHLLREHDRTGTISLSQFWARRIRRLLPAAFTVLAACTVAVFTIMPTVVREETLRQIAAASAYVLNWVLGFDAVDYLAAGNSATLVQHFWTLSVEEQFYVGWPILLVVIGWIVSRVRPTIPRAATFGWIAAAVFVVSLGYSIYLTWFSPAFAYFATTTRAWEFAAGALLAIVAMRRRQWIVALRSVPVLANTSIVTLTGLVMIAGSAMLLSGSSPFPGYLALFPVVGTVLVIVGGFPRLVPLAWLIRIRPVQFIGDISYSVYLWHWPLITALVVLSGRRPTVLEGVGIVIASLALAAVTKYAVEDPARRARIFVSRRTPAYIFALVGILSFGLIWMSTSASIAAQVAADREAAQEQILDESGCFGANAMLGNSSCPERFVLTPEVDLTAAANDLKYQEWCLTWYDVDWASCEFGDLTASRTIALVGDSHAASMVEAFDDYFAANGVKVVTFTRFGCSGLNQGSIDSSDQSELGLREQACRVWSDRVRDEIAARDDISTVVYLNYSSSYTLNRGVDYQLTADDAVATWEEALSTGKRIISIKDWPRTNGDQVPECLAPFVGETAPCSMPRGEAIPGDAQDEALLRLDGAVEQIDLTDAYCDADRCYSVIGDVVVYADHNHISGTYSRTLMNYLGPLILG
jgi:peptidoglycan/LPS O-acetylase OafA/YrhL